MGKQVPESARYHQPIKTSVPMNMSIGTKPTLIEVKGMRFLIMDAPKQGNLHLYIKEMRKQSVTDIVRVCEPTYVASELTTAGIQVHEMEYTDGTSPPKELIDKWLLLVDQTFFQQKSGGDSNPCIAVHCVAGLGRAPVMVAIALIEFVDMDPVEAVALIRRQRRGAINEKQLLYLEKYKKSYKKGDAACCIIL
ncbi:Protein tyrosine phosphatase PRL-1 [Seminavis robusta]|uniref:protein-tyrosine-phosphatase n=1 Tax=Seminavis robusta TaxID=568900 RepID=A0A9N8HMA3_9STRA|nr:Protein tyrosine phosphatase PRL-1 [Seminavis robusta]|eukprot:Sro1099_g241050.1 Protein tyrosine phosphatase PRL-1 (194) ;mRNA; f:789-1370